MKSKICFCIVLKLLTTLTPLVLNFFIEISLRSLSLGATADSPTWANGLNLSKDLVKEVMAGSASIASLGLSPQRLWRSAYLIDIGYVSNDELDLCSDNLANGAPTPKGFFRIICPATVALNYVLGRPRRFRLFALGGFWLDCCWSENLTCLSFMLGKKWRRVES